MGASGPVVGVGARDQPDGYRRGTLGADWRRRATSAVRCIENNRWNGVAGGLLDKHLHPSYDDLAINRLAVDGRFGHSANAVCVLTRAKTV